MNKVREEIYKGFTIQIVYDDCCPESPRDWENPGTMICWHQRYNLGDKHKFTNPTAFKRDLAAEADPHVELAIDYWENGNGYVRLRPDWKAIDERVNDLIEKVLDKHYIMLPVYLYDHSGIAISTSPFSCPWDSGQVGFIYVSYADIRKEYSCKKVTKAIRRKVIETLEAEAKTYDSYLRGEVYGFQVLDEDGDAIDSCYGFYGDLDYCLQEARESADWYRKDYDRIAAQAATFAEITAA